MKVVHTEACRLGRERCSRRCRTVYEGKDVKLVIKNPDGTETVIIQTFMALTYDYELTRHDTLVPTGVDIYDSRGEKP